MAKRRTKLEEARMFVSNLYPGVNWKFKVSLMKPSQVMAIYRSRKDHPLKEQKFHDEKVQIPYQYNIFDYLPKEENT